MAQPPPPPSAGEAPAGARVAPPGARERGPPPPADAPPVRLRLRPWHEALLVPLLLAALVLAWHGRVLDDFWAWDDAQFVKHATLTPAWQDYLVPEAWRRMTPLFFTPWLVHTYRIDLALGGLDPSFAYAHSLVSALLLGCACYALLRTWAAPGWALAAVALLLLSAPALTSVQQVQSRHYVEGLAVMAVALRLFVAGVRRQQSGLLLLSALGYLFALACKEIFAPLVLAPLLLPVGTFRQRLRAAVPWLLLALLYPVWRGLMLDHWIGGHRATVTPEILASVPRMVVENLLGAGLAGRLALVALVALALAALVRRPAARWLLPGAALALLPPLVPVAHTPLGPGRYELLTSWFVLSGLAVLLGPRTGRALLRPSLGVALVLLVGLAVVQRGLSWRPQLQAWLASYQEKGRFLWRAAPDEVLLAEDGLWYEVGVAWMRAHLGDGVRPDLAMDTVELADRDLAGRRVFAYDAAAQAVRDITAELPARLARWRARTDLDKPFAVSVRERDGQVELVFGEYPGATYTVIDHDHLGRQVMGAFLVAPWVLRGPLVFRVRCDSPEGWTTYSPRLTFEGRPGEHLRWAR